MSLALAGILGPILIDIGAPILAKSLGIPSLAAPATELLKRGLGLAMDASPGAVADAVQANPGIVQDLDRQADAQWGYMIEAEKTRATQSTNIHETIRADIAAQAAANMGKIPWWSPRHLINYIPFAYGGVMVGAMPFVFAGFIDATVFKLVLDVTFAAFGAVCGLCGYIIGDNTKRSEVAATGMPAEGPIGRIVKTFLPKK